MTRTKKRIFLIAYGILAAFGLVFLGLTIFTEDQNNTYLGAALASIIAANALNLIKNLRSKRN